MQPLLGTDLDCLFLAGSSLAKMWTVPWSLDTHSKEESWLKLILFEEGEKGREEEREGGRKKGRQGGRAGGGGGGGG